MLQMMMLKCFILVLYFAFAAAQCSNGMCKDLNNGEYSFTIRMPNAVPSMPDDHICTAVKLDQEETYIIRFKPHAKKETVHHMTIHACRIPGSQAPTWQCSKRYGKDNQSICIEGVTQNLYNWALDAPDKSLPEGIGFRVSGQTNLNYIVLQIHYAKAFPPGFTDNSGYTLVATKKRPMQLANYLIMASGGLIPPKEKAYYIDISCTYDKNFTIFPIGYRTHSHNLGYVISGYRIRNGTWTEIGRMSPQLPQTYYPVTHPGMDISRGDVLVARCTMNSMARTDITYVGPTNHDEMCVLYILYSTFNFEQQPTDYCLNEATDYKWELDETVDMTNMPKDVSSLKGVAGADIVDAIFSNNGTLNHHSHGHRSSI